MNLHRYDLTLFFAIAMLASGCAGPTTRTAEQREILSRTQTIWVNTDADQRDVPPGAAGVWIQVGEHVKSKLAAAGFSIAPDERSADATLSVYVNFVYFKPVAPNTSTQPADTRYLRVQVQLSHRQLGRLYQDSALTPPPYQSTFLDAAAIKNVDTDTLWSLYKVRDPRLIDYTCPKLNYDGARPASRVEAQIRVQVVVDGTATSTELVSSSGIPDLDRAMLKQFRDCRYAPAYRDGRPIAGVGTFTNEFVPK